MLKTGNWAQSNSLKGQWQEVDKHLARAAAVEQVFAAFLARHAKSQRQVELQKRLEKAQGGKKAKADKSTRQNLLTTGSAAKAAKHGPCKGR